VRKHARRVIIGMAAVAAMAVLPVASASAHGYGDFVAGFGQNNPGPDFPINYFAFAAHSDSGGANPFGFVGFADLNTRPFHIFAGPVTCLDVQGNKAEIVISIGFATVPNPNMQGGGDVVEIEDNGRPSHGHPVDKIKNGLFPASQWDKHQTCSAPTSIGDGRILTSGDILVHDGSM
jgi:hypothetical protein